MRKGTSLWLARRGGAGLRQTGHEADDGQRQRGPRALRRLAGAEGPHRPDSGADRCERGIRGGVQRQHDVIAIGALRAARRLGRRIPAGPAGVGFGGLQLGTLVEPTLTTVVLDTENSAH